MPIIRNLFAKAPTRSIYSKDPYYNNVSLLLLMDIEDGQNSFTDLSIQNHQLSTYGNPTISTTEFKYGNGSMQTNYINNSSIIIEPTNSSLDLSNVPYTIEFWIYPFYFPPVTYYLFSKGLDIAIGLENSDSYFTFTFGNVQINTNIFIPGYEIWTHIALVSEDGYNHKFFVNGELKQTFQSTITNNSNRFSVGGVFINPSLNHPVWPINGYTDEFRITKGIARYSSNFTPTSVQRFGADVERKINFLKSNSNKKIAFNKKLRGSIYEEDPYYDKVALLLDFENGLVDESKYNHSITTFGDLAVSETDKKFGAKSLQLETDSIETNTNKYLEIQNTNGAFNLGDQDFTIECWVKRSQDFYFMPFVTFLNSSNAGIHRFGGRFSSGPDNGGDSRFRDINNNEYSLNNIYIPDYNTNSWYHYAVVRGNGKLYFYIDGVLQTFSSGFTSNLNFLNINQSLQNIDKIWINRAFTFVANSLNGYMDNIRITVGHARYIYPNNFTPEDFQKYQYIPPITV